MLFFVALFTSFTALAADLPLAWRVNNEKWNKAITIDSAGHVYSAGSRSLFSHDPISGQITNTQEICPIIKNGLGMLGEQFVIVCSNRIDLLAPTERISKVKITHQQKTTATAIHQDVIAIGTELGHLWLYDTKTWKMKRAARFEDPVQSIAISPDGKQLAIGTRKGKLFHYNRPAHIVKRLSGYGTNDIRALSFSPNGKLLFGHTGTFKATVIELAVRKKVATFRTGSWLTTSMFWDDNHILATGSDGLVMYSIKSPGQALQHYPINAHQSRASGEGLAASGSSKTFCAGDRRGSISCWRDASVTPKSRPVTGQNKPKETQNSPSSANQTSTETKLIKRAGPRLTLTLTKGKPPATGKTVEVQKYVNKKVGTVKLSMWMVIATAKVESVQGKTIVLRIVKEQSNVTIKGKKHDYFTTGSVLKIR